MENNFFKSVIDADDAPVVICDLEHTIVYMNPTAVKRYEKRGGAALVGRSIKGCHNGDSNDKIEHGSKRIRATTRCILSATKRKIRTFT